MVARCSPTPPASRWCFTPRAAVRHVEAIPTEVDPAVAVERELVELGHHAATSGVHSIALAVDPYHWQLVHFTLWENTAPESPDDAPYQVLHVSKPHMDALVSSIVVPR